MLELKFSKVNVSLFPKAPYNRTMLELKLLQHGAPTIQNGPAYNRTMLELKLGCARRCKVLQNPYNRTMLELKYRTVAKASEKNILIIVQCLN